MRKLLTVAGLAAAMVLVAGAGVARADDARTLDLPYAHVYGVATFYTMYRRQPGGRQTIRMCTNISCMLRGGYDILHHIEGRLGIKAGDRVEHPLFKGR